MLIQAIKYRLRLRKIEKAIGMRMNRWQRKFVLDPNCRQPMPGGRANGKTVAACVWMLLHEKGPVRIGRITDGSDRYSTYYMHDTRPCFIPDPDIKVSRRAASYTVRTLLEMREKCKARGIEVFKIC